MGHNPYPSSNLDDPDFGTPDSGSGEQHEGSET